MRRLLLTVFFLLGSSPLYAQTHECDIPNPPTSLTVVAGSPITVKHCYDGKDSTGQIPLTPTGFALYDNGLRTTPTFVRGTTSSVSGKTLYTATMTAPTTPTLHTLQSAALSGTVEGAKSDPFALTVIAPTPSKVVSLTITTP